MGSIDGEIPALWFLISSIGFIILSLIQYKNTGKSINTIFLSIMAVLFFLSYFILLSIKTAINNAGSCPLLTQA